MPERKLRAGPAAWIINVILCAVLIVLAVSGLAAGAGVWWTFLFFLAAIAGLWMAWSVATGEGAWLQIDPDGFTKHTWIRDYRHRWVDVSAFRIVEAGPSLFGLRRHLVAFSVPGEAGRGLMQRLADPLDAACSFSHNYDMEADHLADLLNDYRDAALMSEGVRAHVGPVPDEGPEKGAENSPQGAH